MRSSGQGPVDSATGPTCISNASPAPDCDHIPTEHDRSMRDRLHDIHFRSIRPDDAHRLQRFHSTLSPSTAQLRFHAAKRELSEPLARYFTNLDGHDNVGLVATTGTRGRIVGVARYFRISPTAAEVAFVVQDAYQHRGLGSRLMKRLKETAQSNGITQFVAEVLPGNSAMVALLQEAGSTRSHPYGGVIEVCVDLT